MKAAKLTCLSFFLFLFCNSNTVQYTSHWSESEEIRNRDGVLVSYRAKLDGDMLIIEASHASGWHTYTMDNVERAMKKSGKAEPETELPTRIELSGGLKTAGNWFQSKPVDISIVEIRWYTWGFADTSLFVVQVERVDGDKAAITVNGQVCDANTCSDIDDLVISLPLPSKEQFESNKKSGSFDLSPLVKVEKSRKNPK